MNVRTRNDAQIEALYEKDFPCDNLGHTENRWGHVAAMGASWSVTAPCGVQHFLCDPFWKLIVEHGAIACAHCRNTHTLADLAVRPV